ncbi:MAG: ATP-binding protein [candidate division NC10 bacterium]|nr:ATP-binding protein [candidate division NC10 bacterium]
MIPEEVIGVLRDLNPWWADPELVRPAPPPYRRRAIQEIEGRLRSRGKLIEVIRGPRQVGKTTGIRQIIQDLLHGSVPSHDILFIRFDLEVLRECPGGLRAIVHWFADAIMQRKLGSGAEPYIFLDEIHKLRRWDEEVKHLGDTFPVRLVLTGSSSVLVARGGRESLAGRVFSTEIPPFLFREVVEAWRPKLAEALPSPLRFSAAFEREFRKVAEAINELKPQQKLTLRRQLERYFNRGGYPRLHSGEVEDDRWADYLVQTVFENVLGADIPDLFPAQDPRLLRHLYLSVARHSGKVVSQPFLTQEANDAGFRTTQPTVGRYLHYLADALLIREFRRYPLVKRRSARVPAKIALSDLGVRNAIFRGAPSLWESDPVVLGPLVETLVQSVIRDVNLQVHFWRDYEKPGDRKSPPVEVDFVAERIDGTPLPIEVKFRKRIDPEDTKGVQAFLSRYRAPHGIIVTRDLFAWNQSKRILCIPLLEFLLAF